VTTFATPLLSQAVQRIRAGSLRAAQPASSPDLVSLAMGEPGFDTPPAIRLAALECGYAHYAHYAHPHGDPELREALAAQLSAAGALEFKIDDVLLTHGGTGGLAAAILADLCAATGTIVLADEAYADLVHTDEPITSALDVPHRAERTLYCQTFSKAYAMTGWRLVYLAGPTELLAAAARIHATIAGPLNAATQRAALTAVVTAAAAVQEMHDEYRIRRDLIVDRLDGRHLAAPDGAFYAFPRYDHGLVAIDMVAHLRAHSVAVRLGSEFGPAGEHCLRLSFAGDRDAITTGIERLRGGLADLAHPQEARA
jgi:aspartate/methionine/tyrosine aminotransferase